MTSDDPLIAALRPITSRVRTDKTAVKPAGAKNSFWTGTEKSGPIEALTDERMANHLNGGPARGVCPLREGESTVELALLDFDSHKGETTWPEMSEVVGRVVGVLELAWGASPVLFRSTGGRGVHLYLLWDAPQDAYSVREWLGGVLQACGLKNGAGGRGVADGLVEVFPKQDCVALGESGSQFILPMAGKGAPLRLCEISGMLEVLDRDAVLGFGWEVSPPVPVVERPVRTPRAAGDAGPGLAVLAEALDAIPNGREPGTDLSYDDMMVLVFGVHWETEGSDEGLALVEQVARRSGRHNQENLEKYWAGASRDGRAGGSITGRSVLHLAARWGWVRPEARPDADAFDVVVVPEAPADGRSGEVELPAWDREKSGAVKPTVTNAVLALRRPDLCGTRVAHDEFRDEITVSPPGCDEWVPMTDADVVRMRMRLEALRFKSAPKELARDALVLVAAENKHDSAQMWLRGVEARWDGRRRVDRFLVDYMGCTDGEYERAVSRYLWTALAGRVLEPGVKADMVPIYEGEQGLRKSSAIEALVPAPEFFVEVDLEEDEADTVRKLRGALVGEIAELSGLHTRALEAIKKFVVRKVEKWVPKYKEFPSTFARRLVFIGTTNRTDILADETGNRRWLPVHIERADAEGIGRDRDQLWAEGAAMFRGLMAGEGIGPGVAWQDAERLAGGFHDAYTVEDPWSGAVASWLGEADPFDAVPPGAVGAAAGAAGVVSGIAVPVRRGVRPFTSHELMAGALGLHTKEMDKLAQKRVGAILKRAGYVARTVRRDGMPTWCWVRPM